MTAGLRKALLSDYKGWGRTILAGRFVELKDVPRSIKQVRGNFTSFVVNPSNRPFDRDILSRALHLQRAEAVRNEFGISQAAFGQNHQEIIIPHADAKIRAAARFPQTVRKLL